MRIVSICSTTLTLLFVFIAAAFAQVPAPLRGVEVLSSVNFDEKIGIYEYSYSITNPSSNSEDIAFMEIDIVMPSESKPLNSEGLVIEKGFNWQGKMIRISFDADLQAKKDAMKKEVLPVGMKVPVVTEGPNNWGAAVTVMGKALWGGSEKSLVHPGESLDGFVLTSYGVPCLLEVLIKPAYIAKAEDIFSTGVTEKEYLENRQEVVDNFYKSISYYTKTVGPTAPPAELVPLDFLENIISMKHEAVSLGWITNKGIEMGLDQKLEAVKNKLRQGNNGAARNILRAFIHEVEAQGCPSYDDCPRGKHLKPEAYAILKYNAQYLVDNLK